MAKITRKTQQIFGSNAGANQRAQFGSLAAGAPAFSTDPETIQSLSNYLNGWFDAVIGNNSPAIEDMNALCFLFAYQLAYIMQAGVPEWDDGTTYYIGSFASDGTGEIYVSLTDDNINNALTDDTNWRLLTGAGTFETFTGDGSWTAPSGVTKVRVSVFGLQTGVTSNYLGSLGFASFALTTSGALYGWGINSDGELGDGTTTAKSSPVLVLGGLSWRQISSGTDTIIGISNSGDAYGWGKNQHGQLGNGSVTVRSSPVLVLGGLKWRQVASGSTSALGLSSAGTTYAWGRNQHGQLGLGDVVSRSSPILVLGGNQFTQVTAGEFSNYGLTADGAVYGWGYNVSGQLGTGDVIPRSSPVLVLGGLQFTQIAAGGYSVFGITTSGDMYAWGGNAFGQLGQGDVTPRSSPVLVLGGLKWKTLGVCGSTTEASVYGITTSGDMYAWGANNAGRLGLGDVAARSTPVLVLGGLKWVAPVFSGSAYNGAGVTTGGLLYNWGNNQYGNLGDGTTVSKSSPVLVLGGFYYPAVYEILTNQVMFDVTPGQSYDIKIFGAVTLFNNVGIYQDQYGGVVPTKVILEY